MRSFAILPAAGHSVRMGRPKLLLPWGNATVIEHVLRAWSESEVSEIVLVLRKDDHTLAHAARGFRAHLVMPDVDPPEMKVSIRNGLDFIKATWQPETGDVWFVAPADLPQLPSSVINRVLSAHQPMAPEILVPFVNGQRAHPVLFPWQLAADVPTLGEKEGVNALLNRYATRAIACDETGILLDLDTPEDYERSKPDAPS